MKDIFMRSKLAFIPFFALFVTTACSTSAPQDEEIYYNSDMEHWALQIGFKDAETANLYENNEYAVLSLANQWNLNWALIPEEVERPETQQLLYSYETQEYYKIFDTKHYYTVEHNFYAYYSAIVEWDSYTEFKEYQGVTECREIRKNLKCTKTNVAYTKDTPSQYLSAIVPTQIFEYPDSEGEWLTLNSGSAGDDTAGGGDSSYGSESREYSYHTAVISVNKRGVTDDLYIYKNSSGNYRGSWIYSAAGLDKAATSEIYFDPTIMNDVLYNYYISVYGDPWYFNFSK